MQVSHPTQPEGGQLSSVLNPSITQIQVGTNTHDGFVRVHIDQYLGQSAQSAISNIVGGIAGISEATILAEQQTIIIIAEGPNLDETDLKKLFTSFVNALNDWYTQLDELDINLMSYRPRIEEAMAINSKVSPYGAYGGD